VTGENGLLVPPGDTRALAEALLALKKDSALRERMGLSSRQYVERFFDRRDFVESLVDYYGRMGIRSNARRDAACLSG